jgi:hypothetical protein
MPESVNTCVTARATKIPEEPIEKGIAASGANPSSPAERRTVPKPVGGEAPDQTTGFETIIVRHFWRQPTCVVAPYRFLMVDSGQSSVRNWSAGRPSAL